MTTATAPVPARCPAPPGARNPYAAPTPGACYRCGGTDPSGCHRCGGSGVEFARFDLPPSRSRGLRRVRYEPTAGNAGRLFVGLAAHKLRPIVWTEYAVAETANEWGGRSFRCAKIGTDRSHNCFVGAGAVSCECEAATYVTAAKANQRAYEGGGETFPTHGCVHADAVAALVLGGWFDLT